MKKLLLITFFGLIALSLSACNLESNAEVSIGYKTTGGSGDYDATIQEFVIGDSMYVGISTQIFTNKKSPKIFDVIIEIEKVDSVEFVEDGGITRESLNESDPNWKIFSYKMTGKSENPIAEIIEFKAIPIAEGSAIIRVKIYDEDGNLVKNYFDTCYFVY